MSVHQTHQSNEPINWSKRLKWATVFTIFLALVATGYWYFQLNGIADVQRAVAEADRLDPGWRLEELEANREHVPDTQNAALLVIKVAGDGKAVKGMMPSWPNRKLEESLGKLHSPAMLMSEAQVAAMRDFWDRGRESMLEARKLAEMPRGRFPGRAIRLDFSINDGPMDAVRSLIHLMKYDWMMAAHEGYFDEALLSCRAAFNGARSFGDGPDVYGILVRDGCQSIVLNGITRVLAQGEASEGALLKLQTLLESELDYPSLLNTFRGRRAELHEIMNALRRGELSLADPSMGVFHGSSAISIWDYTKLRLAIGWERIKIGSYHKHHAAMLEFSNQAVEFAKLSEPEQVAEYRSLLEAGDRLPGYARSQTRNVTEKMVVAYRQVHAQLRATIVAVAAERFRLKTGRFPNRLEELVPDYISEVPRDPFVDAPLLMNRNKEGLVIYSVFSNGKDDGGDLDWAGLRIRASSPDYGFQLWDVDKRRQPALPIPVE